MLYISGTPSILKISPQLIPAIPSIVTLHSKKVSPTVCVVGFNIFLNPPFGSKNQYYFKFLLYGLKMLNNSTSKNSILVFISPSMIKKKIVGNGRNYYQEKQQFSDITYFLKSGKGEIMDNRWLKWK